MAKGAVAGTSPQMVELEEGKKYAWCSCGQSSNQPWCSGAHKGSGFSPVMFTSLESKTAAMCMCKQSDNLPYCDGSHMKVATT